ncbi:lipocalin family protein [Psychroserpens sp. AS72]|uniref:lipocalin family protein n=1 Tax=Psychroserpens sp. AS72 TaxID=3135775 RepID=UPI0031801ADE
MKTFKTLSILLVTFILFSCSSDDDNNSQQQSTQELLTSGKWYQESRTPGSYTICDKVSYIQFTTNNNFELESFEENGDDCISLGLMTATYTLTENMTIEISFEGELISTEIIGISAQELTLLTSENETLVFDKTEG